MTKSIRNNFKSCTYSTIPPSSLHNQHDQSSIDRIRHEQESFDQSTSYNINNLQAISCYLSSVKLYAPKNVDRQLFEKISSFAQEQCQASDLILYAAQLFESQDDLLEGILAVLPVGYQMHISYEQGIKIIQIISLSGISLRIYSTSPLSETNIAIAKQRCYDKQQQRLQLERLTLLSSTPASSIVESAVQEAIPTSLPTPESMGATASASTSSTTTPNPTSITFYSLNSGYLSNQQQPSQNESIMDGNDTSLNDITSQHPATKSIPQSQVQPVTDSQGSYENLDTQPVCLLPSKPEGLNEHEYKRTRRTSTSISTSTTCVYLKDSVTSPSQQLENVHSSSPTTTSTTPTPTPVTLSHENTSNKRKNVSHDKLPPTVPPQQRQQKQIPQAYLFPPDATYFRHPNYPHHVFIKQPVTPTAMSDTTQQKNLPMGQQQQQNLAPYVFGPGGLYLQNPIPSPYPYGHPPSQAPQSSIPHQLPSSFRFRYHLAADNTQRPLSSQQEQLPRPSSPSLSLVQQKSSPKPIFVTAEPTLVNNNPQQHQQQEEHKEEREEVYEVEHEKEEQEQEEQKQEESKKDEEKEKQSSKPPYITEAEASLIDRIREHFVHPQGYQYFLKLITLYSTGFIDKNSFVEHLAPLFESNVSLLEQIQQLIGHGKDLKDERPLQLSASSIPKPDISRCIKVNSSPSYRRVTDLRWVNQPCSARDDICREVLNDIYVSHPTEESEGSNADIFKLNKYEEQLHRCEEKRYEFDSMIDDNDKAIVQLQYICDEAQLDTMSPEQKKEFNKTVDLNKFIFIKAIKAAYGKRFAPKAIQGFKKHPAQNIPIIIRFLEAEGAKWRQARHELKDIWREIETESHYLSLEYQLKRNRGTNGKR
ncbi:Sin3 family co-repressor-domain-containing protein [Phascolomyces articulosus]|uniref:Sin3 family co-repressor-domain-containing protein n=1 Tax=Phascolomyces articulosus TaxID=60185 RepID=A0AAD5KD64_9FUNG|nr:Sin3 family co-repressor-domain-containing protein [Phascolomyces articulosus]